MNVNKKNEALFRGEIEQKGLFPHLEEIAEAAFRFRVEFGLGELPREPGILIVRGPRQYGKSTWLEGELKNAIQRHGPGSGFYLNGDEITNERALAEAILELVTLFSKSAKIRRIFIDEITAVANWQNAVKRLVDDGSLRGVLLVTTGSNSTDLRRGSERLPGRKGKLDRSNYLFTPIPYREFKRVCGKKLKAKTLIAYLMSGGCPLAGRELAARGRLPEYVPIMIHDWIYGECAASKRPRSSLLAVFEQLLKRGGTPLGQAKLAREAGLANNAVAAGYIELLADLMCVGIAQNWDASKNIRLTRKPAKYHLINLLAALSWDRNKIRTVADFEALPPKEQGKWFEWLVAQELCRRAAIRGDEFPEQMIFWQSKEHELDFVLGKDNFIEVKRGKISPLDYTWFPKVFPRGLLTIIGTTPFETDRIRGLSMEEFLEAEE